MKRPVAFVVISTLLVWMGTVCAQIITGSISFSQIAGTINLATQSSGTLAVGNGGTGSASAPSAGQLLVGNAGGTAYAPQSLSGSGATMSMASTGVLTLSGVTPGAGGVGAMTGAPMWARFFGNGAESAGPANGTLTCGEHWYTSWTVTGAIVASSGCSIIVRSQGTVALNTGASLATTGTNGNLGNLGGAGGSGGAGAANSSASSATTWFNPANAAVGGAQILSAAAGASAGGAGNNGGVISSVLAQMAFSLGYPFRCVGGGIGTAGGSTGGAAGSGGGCIVIIAPTITIASGVTLDASGGPGVAPVANSTGAGGGGGGGVIWLASESFTDSGAIYKYGGGPGGAVTQPSIQATGGGCDTTGCGTGAVLTVTGVTTGGLDAAKITITNGGSGYLTAPTCRVNAGGSGLTGSPACHFTIAAGAINAVVIDTAGSGATFTGFTTAFIGGYGANGFYQQVLLQ